MGKPREAGGGPSGPNRSEAEGPWWPPGYSGAVLSSASVVWARDLGLKGRQNASRRRRRNEELGGVKR